jgi:mRNA interferase HigB
VRVIAKPALVHFWDRFPDAKGPLEAWYAVMRHRDFRSPNQLKAEFGSVSLLGEGYAVFNIGGNKYRLLVHVRYDVGIVFVKRVLTHAEYDELNAAGTLIQKRSSNG